jgi:hypothetical protein
LDQIWEWNGAFWALRPLFPTPGQRPYSGMAFDRARNEIVLYAGKVSGSPHDTWRLHMPETWVDFAYPGAPNFPEVGSFAFPFNTLAEGVNSAQAGSIIQIKAGSGNETIRITKPLYLRAYGGPVRIGP